jgi:hypothetical protein
MFTPNVLMKTDTGIIQTGLVNKGVVLFAIVVNAVLLQIKTHS